MRHQVLPSPVCDQQDANQGEADIGAKGGDRALDLLRRLPRLILMAPIKVYQLTFSTLRGPVCRFYPSCSAYAVTALGRHGAIKGTYLAARRLLRCHPWNPGGVDHVPEVGGIRKSSADDHDLEQ